MSRNFFRLSSFLKQLSFLSSSPIKGNVNIQMAYTPNFEIEYQKSMIPSLSNQGYGYYAQYVKINQPGVAGGERVPPARLGWYYLSDWVPLRYDGFGWQPFFQSFRTSYISLTYQC